MGLEKKSICFCINDAYAQHLAVTLTSILHNDKKAYFNFYVLTSDLSNASKEKIGGLSGNYNNFSLDYIDVDPSLFKDFEIKMDHISIETYYRYVLAQALPKLDKVLYLDVDLIVDEKLDELYNTNIEDYYCSAVPDLYILKSNYKAKIGLKQDEDYFNAGVILFNLKKMREDSIAKTFFDTHHKYSEIIEFQDQDIINMVLKGRIKPAEHKYNYTMTTKKILQKKMKKGCIYHFIGPKKPWSKFSTNQIKQPYYKYLFLSPYSSQSFGIHKFLYTLKYLFKK